MPKMQGRNVTQHIRRHTSENICHAFDFAKWIGRPLNLYVVINFPIDGRISQTTTFARVLHKYRDWLKNALARNGLEDHPPVYVYTHECPDDHPHVNWPVHVPRELQAEFRRKLPKWVAKVIPAPVRAFDIDVQEVDPHTDKTLAKYVIKGTDPMYVSYLHLEAVAASQGVIYGRRATPSISISRAARRAAGFVPRLHRHQWKRPVHNRPPFGLRAGA